VSAFSESVVEDAALGWLQAIGWQIAHGPDIAPDALLAERANYGEVVLGARLRDAGSSPNLQEDREAGT
jgi:type I restriction enzyme R subunit